MAKHFRSKSIILSSSDHAGCIWDLIAEEKSGKKSKLFFGFGYFSPGVCVCAFDNFLPEKK